MANAFVVDMIDGNGNAVEAVVLQGYLRAPDGADPLRIYLSAQFDRWVEFIPADLIRRDAADNAVGNQRDDWSTTVWLRVPRMRPNAEPYKLVTRTDLVTDDGYVRGKLVDDFLDDPASQVVWDEQGYVTAKPSKIYCTA